MSRILDQITPVVLCYNEAPNISRCLAHLTWAERVIVIDSGSTDATFAMVAGFPNAHLLERKFDNHTAQWNYGLDQVKTEWALSLDADYMLTGEFIEELRGLNPAEQTDACHASFRYCIWGHALRGCLYPSRAVLFRKNRCRYVPEGHTQLLSFSGPSQHLTATILHDDHKPLSRWFASQIKYSELEAEFLATSAAGQLSRIDKLRAKAWIMPVLAPFYCLIAKGLWRDGLAGWHYTLQRWVAECMIALALVDRRCAKANQPGHPLSP